MNKSLISIEAFLVARVIQLVLIPALFCLTAQWPRIGWKFQYLGPYYLFAAGLLDVVLVDFKTSSAWPLRWTWRTGAYNNESLSWLIPIVLIPVFVLMIDGMSPPSFYSREVFPSPEPRGSRPSRLSLEKVALLFVWWRTSCDAYLVRLPYQHW